MKKVFHEDFYSYAKYYDIAFDFKDVPKEARFMAEVFSGHSGHPPFSFIEFAAGPALHALEFASQGLQTTAVDLSAEMVAYGRQKAFELGLRLKYDEADMVTYRSDQTYDLAAILMDSISYLITNDQVIDHLRSVAEILNPQGLYFLEMSHPRSVFNISASTTNDWEMERAGIKVHVKWGSEEDVFDPITQVTMTTAWLDYQDGANQGSIINKSPQRCFTATEWDALVRASGCFEVVHRFGAMDEKVCFDNDKKAWRMISVLKRK